VTALLPIVLVVHIGLALSLLVPAVLLPFTLRRRETALSATDGTARAGGGVVRRLVALQARGTVIGFGLLATGLLLLGILGFGLLGQPWLLVALAAYALNLALAFFIQRPGLRRLFGLAGSTAPATPSGEDAWTALARRQRYLSYLMAGLIGTIGFLMSTKPRLW
jgi:hypothetical protein